MNLARKCVTKTLSVNSFRRTISQKSAAVKKIHIEKNDPSLIRNIGILAHIDAGKTTTTERMLFYSGRISHMGEVHHGNTVTDFMDLERDRGITITSAAVTIPWEKHRINLIDTPGHIDFTIEVEQALNVMDGAVIILDGSAGVEAQTITVWKQADKFKIPRIIYINKMDKPQADFFKSQDSVFEYFNVVPLTLQIPVFTESESFSGVVDLLNLVKCEWNTKEQGISFTQKALNPSDGELWKNALNARMKLTESLADLDNNIAEIIIADEKKLETISSSVLKKSIKQITLKQKGCPILCGSSYKNIGVQCLLDAIIDYLPNPDCNQKIMQCFGTSLCAQAFKVRHDLYKGPITFFRIYCGQIKKGQKIYNINKEKVDQSGNIYMVYADDYEEMNEIGSGNIAAVTGLKFSSSGDFITSSSTAWLAAKKDLTSKLKISPNEIFSRKLNIPNPVFFCSVECASQRDEMNLERALNELQREDPSLKVSLNAETGQTILGGMGELHLDIIKERIRKEYKIDVDLGPLLIAYKETLIENAKDNHFVQHDIGSSRHTVNITMSVNKTESNDEEIFFLDKSKECSENIASIFPKHLLAVQNGVTSALASGPKCLCPITNVRVGLHWLEVGKGTSDTIITSATVQCVKKLLIKGKTKLLEPIMYVEVVCDMKNVEIVITDFSKRRAEFLGTNSRGLDFVVKAFVPLSELLGYSSALRILTSGKANFSMEFHGFKEMNAEEESKAVKSVIGF